MNQALAKEDVATTPTTATQDSAWVSIPLPQTHAELSGLIENIETLFRVNPYLTFSQWTQTDTTHYYAQWVNESNQQTLATSLTLTIESRDQFSVHYDQGIKRRTVFTLEDKPQGSLLTLTDDYQDAAPADTQTVEQQVDKSLQAWGIAIQTYFIRRKRWSWLPGWCWYMRRMWVPMKPSGRRIAWLLFLFTVVEFAFFLFVLLIYAAESTAGL